MKILMQNRPKSQWIGGDMIQLEKTMEQIKKGGTEIYFNDQPLFTPAILLSDFDIVHMWNFSMEWTRWQLWAAKKHGRKTICSMIYHDTEAYSSYAEQQIIADNMDAMIFLSEGEVARARKHLTIPDEKIHIIPNGIDAYWLKTKRQDWIKKEYVLTVGRLDGTKGQLETAIACKNLGIEYVCVGEVMDTEYAKSCEENGAYLIGSLPHKELIPVYDNARLFVLASAGEIFPLSVMEAGARGLNSVVTDKCEWKDIPNVEWCKWGDADSIEKAIKKAMNKGINFEFQAKLKSMTWEKVAKQVMKVYESISNNPRI